MEEEPDFIAPVAVGRSRPADRPITLDVIFFQPSSFRALPLEPGVDVPGPSALRWRLSTRVCCWMTAVLGLAHIATKLAGQSVTIPHADLWDLDAERNVPTWFSVLLLAGSGVLWLALGMTSAATRVGVRRMPVLLAAAGFLFLSLDELAGIHEYIGHSAEKATHFEEEGSRLANSGLWPLLCVPAFLVAGAMTLRAVLPLFSGRSAILRKLFLGMGVYLGAAVGLEMLGNLVVNHPFLYQVEVVLEELGEMIGAIILLSGTIDLVESHGIRIWHVAGVAEAKPDVTPDDALTDGVLRPHAACGLDVVPRSQPSGTVPSVDGRLPSPSRSRRQVTTNRPE